MPSRAHVVLVGHLGSDPEERFTHSGSKVVSLSIGVNDGRKGASGEWEDHSSWYRVSVFGRDAEKLAEARKGTLVQVTGRLSTSLWEPTDGKKPRVNLDVMADSVLLLERSTRDEETAPRKAAAPRQAPRRQETTDDLEDLPF